MKKILVVLFILNSVVVFNQKLNNLVYSTKITTISYFNKNDFKKYRVQQSQSVKKDDKPAEISKTEYDMSIKVVDSTETSYKFELIYSNYLLPPTTQEFEKELMTCFKDIKIIYTTNENGEFNKIENIPEIKAATLKMLDLIKKKFTSKLKTEEEKAQFNFAFLGFDAVLNDDENIESLFIEDILFLHGMYGIELKLNEDEVFDIEFAALGDVTVKGTATATLKDINKETKVAKFVVNEKANDGELKNHLESMFKSLFGHVKEGEFDVKKFQVDSKTNQVYFMFLDSGWMKKVLSTTTQTINYEERKIKKVISKEYTLTN
ncbi:MAG: hypothetical protein ACK5B9_04320 [Flavobacteriia bacterium]|jgi:hypothetical protein